MGSHSAMQIDGRPSAPSVSFRLTWLSFPRMFVGRSWKITSVLHAWNSRMPHVLGRTSVCRARAVRPEWGWSLATDPGAGPSL